MMNVANLVKFKLAEEPLPSPVYKDIVKLRVKASRPDRQIIHFMGELRWMPDLQL